MSIRFHRPVVAAALAALVLIACDTPATDPAPATPSLGVLVALPATLEWQLEACTLVVERGMSPLAASRMFAAASMAAMRAVEHADASSDAPVSNDGFTTPWAGSIPVGEGLWTTTALPPAGATLGDVTPWFVTSDEQFWPPPPPEFGSAAFDDDLTAVAAISAGLTEEQRDIALGWAYGGGTYTPVGYWNELASTYVSADGLDEAEAARVFGLMGAAVFDALITTFGAKYHYWLLRPHQADASIVPVFPVPNYPAYPSGHASVSAASARVLAQFFPDRAAELNALVDEAALSRVSTPASTTSST